MENQPFSKHLEENIAQLKETFNHDDTLVLRSFQGAESRRFCLAYIEGMVDTRTIDDDLVRPLSTGLPSGLSTSCGPLTSIVTCSEAAVHTHWEDALGMLLRGDTLVMMEGAEDVLCCNTKGGDRRAVSEPDSERNLRGPRDGFCESLVVNLSLIRRRLQTTDLKCEMSHMGRRGHIQCIPAVPAGQACGSPACLRTGLEPSVSQEQRAHGVACGGHAGGGVLSDTGRYHGVGDPHAQDFCGVQFGAQPAAPLRALGAGRGDPQTIRRGAADRVSVHACKRKMKMKASLHFCLTKQKRSGIV